MNIIYPVIVALCLFLQQQGTPKLQFAEIGEPFRIAIAFDGDTRQVIQYDKEIFPNPPTCDGESSMQASESIQCAPFSDPVCYRRKTFAALRHCGADMKKVRELWGKP